MSELILTLCSSERGSWPTNMHSRFIPVGVSPLGAHIVFDWLPGQAGTVSHFRHFMLGLESRKRARESKRERARDREREREREGEREKEREIHYVNSFK